MVMLTPTEINLSENVLNYNNVNIPFSFREAISRGTFITGMPKSGKSNLGKIIAEHLLSKGITIKVFDPSQTWLSSSLPEYIRVWNNLQDCMDIPLKNSIVFDTSRLYPQIQAEAIGMLVENDFQKILEGENSHSIIYFIEEAQLVLPSGALRARYSQQIFRMVSVGRNFNQRYVLLTQRPADIDVKALSRSGQAYIGQHWEENDLRKLSRLLGEKFEPCRQKLAELQLGEFIYFNPYDKYKIKIETPEYKDNGIIPNFYQKHVGEKKKGFWANLFGG